jgi:protein-tyrosine phosphatase
MKPDATKPDATDRPDVALYLSRRAAQGEPRAAGRAVGRAWALAQRLAHPLRRRAARRRIVARRPRSVLVACHGNICRSPFAAALLARGPGDAGLRVVSAGFVGPGRAPPVEAVGAAARRGVDLSRHRSRLLEASLVRGAELIVVMAPDQGRAVCDRFGRHPGDVVVLGDLDPGPVETRAIRDPVAGTADVFDACYARIERCVGALQQLLADRSPAAR